MNNYSYPQQQMYGTQPTQNYSSFKPTTYAPIPVIRPVSSIEEVRASPIEFDGSIFYFPDIANKKIYTKFINLDGQVSVNLYELKEINMADQSIDSSNFITRTEFEEVINNLKQLYNPEMSQPVAQPQQQNFKF